jgi:hypothetical protein
VGRAERVAVRRPWRSRHPVSCFPRDLFAAAMHFS